MVVYGNHELGFWRGFLATGCRLCMAGLKVVLFVSEGCYANCFYCPLSAERRRLGAFYVDEELVSSPQDVIDEISAVGALGIAVTGGEPLLALPRLLEVLKVVRDVYGSSIHVHLYTSAYPVPFDSLAKVTEFVDEVRIHPVSPTSWSYLQILARENVVDVGVEVPSIPAEPVMKAVVKEAWKRGAKFVNLNELEVSPTNLPRLTIRGLEPAEDGRSVRGSLEVAMNVLRWVEDVGIDIGIHVCPASYKDRVQHRRRLLRKARALALPENVVEEEGVVISGESYRYPMLDELAPLIKAGR